MHAMLGLVAALPMLNGCDGHSPSETGRDIAIEDEDGDGSSADEDCDDADATVHPAAVEVCNQRDDDCDGDADDADASLDGSTTTPWFVDNDGDEYGSAGDGVSACAAPEGRVADGTDCDDQSADVHPGATEVCNALDDDCDGFTDDDDDGVDTSTGTAFFADLDGDGFGDDESVVQACAAGAGRSDLGGDCDDGDATVSPGASDACGDGIDQDCEGGDRSCDRLSGDVDPATEAQTVIYGTDEGGIGGAFVVLDYNGDGQDDLAVGDYGSQAYADDGGAVRVYPGPVAEGEIPEDSSYVAAYYGDKAGRVGGILYALGDLDGDGTDDMYVFCSSSGSGRESCGPVPGGGSGVMLMRDELYFNLVCYGVSAGGDPDGDGVNGWGCGNGSLWWFEGTSSTVVATVSSTTGATLGMADVLAFDVTGDGVNDPWLGAYDESRLVRDGGYAFLFEGPITTVSDDQAVASFRGDNENDELGGTIALADLDGDGDVDLLAGAAGDDLRATNAGAIFAWFSPVSGADVSASTADIVIRGTAADEALGIYQPGVGDVDGDGQDDLSFGSYMSDGGGRERGAAWLFYGPLLGRYDVEDATTLGAHVTGAAADDHLGADVHSGSDLNGDAIREWVMGAHGAGWDAGADDGGVLFVLPGS